MQQRWIGAATLAACTVGLVAVLTLRHVIRRQKKPCRGRHSAPKYRLVALLRYVSSKETTPWKIILSSGADDDFLVSDNFTIALVIERILPLFSQERENFNFGSPFRNGPKTKGRRALLETLDILGMVLWYLKTKGTMFSLCPIFGITGSTIGVWLYYSSEVLIRVVKREKDFEIRWTTHE